MTGRTDERGNPLIYIVSLANDGHYECGCMSWTRQRKWLIDGHKAKPWETPNGHCKHIVFVIANEEQLRNAITHHGTVRVQTEEVFIEVISGRISGLIADL